MEDGITVLSQKILNTEFFWSVFFGFWTKYGKIQGRKNSVFGRFSRSVSKVPVFLIASYMFNVNNGNTKKGVKYVES